MLRAPPYKNPGALRGACVAQELRKSLGETRGWVEKLDEEVGVVQAVAVECGRYLPRWDGRGGLCGQWECGGEGQWAEEVRVVWVGGIGSVGAGNWFGQSSRQSRESLAGNWELVRSEQSPEQGKFG